MLLSEFDFLFPENLIAYEPLPRGTAKMLVVKAHGEIQEKHTEDLIDYLSPGDALVLNDTRVLPARLLGHLSSGAKMEALLLSVAASPNEQAVWDALLKPGKKAQIGSKIIFSENLQAEVVDILLDGSRRLAFNVKKEDFYTVLQPVGKIPLPPYIERDAKDTDLENYQSVFAKNLGSVAAPTASLHLNQNALDKISAKGIRIVYVTLHVSAGTFRPVQTENIEEHPMHAEQFEFSVESAALLNQVKAAGKKIFAVGTTASRVLETQAQGVNDTLVPGVGETRYFIYPGYRWKVVDGLLTNFHWPKSTLFMLVCSRLGTARAQAIYAEAFANKYRLFSYGDAMLLL